MCAYIYYIWSSLTVYRYIVLLLPLHVFVSHWERIARSACYNSRCVHTNGERESILDRYRNRNECDCCLDVCTVIRSEWQKKNTTTNQQQNTQHNNRRHINEKLSESHLFEQENRFHLHVLLNIFEDDDVDNDDGRPSKYKSKAATNKKNRKIIEPAQFEQLMSYKFAF